MPDLEVRELRSHMRTGIDTSELNLSAVVKPVSSARFRADFGGDVGRDDRLSGNVSG